MDSSQSPITPIVRTLPVLRWWWVAAAATVATALTALAMWWLLTQVGHQSDISVASAELDAIRTSLSVGIGAGGAFALWLAARRQRSTELQLAETARIAADTKAHQELVAESTASDLRERRITDLYTKAVEQLGSEKAPVRLGGLYALERLALGNPDHRQTVTNVICAYLRMPYKLPDKFKKDRYYDSGPPKLEFKPGELPKYEELQVRTTAQEIIAHLVQPTSGSETVPWVDIDLDLSGATLVRFDLSNCRIRKANFSHVDFASACRFIGVEFTGEAWFFEAEFKGIADFDHTSFHNRAIFTRCQFEFVLLARHINFKDEAFFGEAAFRSKADFTSAKFEGEVNFQDSIIESTDELAEGGWPAAQFIFKDATVDYSNKKFSHQLPQGWQVGSTLRTLGEILPAHPIEEKTKNS